MTATGQSGNTLKHMGRSVPLMEILWKPFPHTAPIILGRPFPPLPSRTPASLKRNKAPKKNLGKGMSSRRLTASFISPETKCYSDPFFCPMDTITEVVDFLHEMRTKMPSHFSSLSTPYRYLNSPRLLNLVFFSIALFTLIC